MECTRAFVIGGLICVAGQVLIGRTRLIPARVLVTFVTLGVILTAVGLYGPLVQFAGTGAIVPLSGFGYAIAKGTEEAMREHGLLGALMGGVTSSVAGIVTTVFFGCLAALIAESGDRS